MISLLNYNEADDTIECVETLQKMDYPNFDILLVDNVSTDDSVERIRARFPDIPLKISGGNYGYAYGHKVSVDYGLERDYDLIWVLNNDLVVFKDTLSALVRGYLDHKPCIVGSLTFKAEDSDIISFGGGHEMEGDQWVGEYNVYEGRSYAEVKDKCLTRRVSAVEGSSIMIPMDVIREHGFMDLDYFIYGEETDYCMKLGKKGIPSILVAESKVVHEGGLTFSRPSLSVVTVYYRMRNALRWRHNQMGLSRWGILQKKGGIIPMSKFYLKWFLSGRQFKEENRVNWYENLAIIHAFFGIKGKIVSPERIKRRAAKRGEL